MLLSLLLRGCIGAHHPPMMYHDGAWSKVEYGDDGPSSLQPPPPILPAETSSQTIFVQLASYRDARCGKTLHELFSRAAHPERIIAGVVDQLLPGDKSCVEEYCALDPTGCRRGQVRVVTLDASKARGPTAARARQAPLVAASRAQFCLQLDSHSEATDGWDRELLEEWRAARNEYAVLTTYIADVDQRSVHNVNNDQPYLCTTVWGMGGMVRNAGAAATQHLTRPLMSALWGAGLSFSKCHAELAVPYDPSTPGVFDGEEFARAARLWTRGYDMYAPSRSLLMHNYHKRNPRSWAIGGGDPAETAASYARLKSLLRMPGGDPALDLGAFGLGRARTLAQFEKFSGVDLKGHGASKGRDCGRMRWVPWKEERRHGAPRGEAAAPPAPDSGTPPAAAGGAGGARAAAAEHRRKGREHVQHRQAVRALRKISAKHLLERAIAKARPKRAAAALPARAASLAAAGGGNDLGGAGGVGVDAGGVAQHVASWPLLVLVVLAAVVVRGGGAGRTLRRCIASLVPG